MPGASEARSPTTLGVCNLCEAICGLELTVEGTALGPGDGDPRQPRRPALPRLPLPQGRLARRRAHRPRPAASTRTPRRHGADAEWVEIGWDEALDLVADGPGRRDQRARPQRRRRLPRQPQRALARLGHPRPGHGEDAAHPQPLQRLVGRPDPAPARRLAALRPPAAAADPRHRPHVVLPGVRRQPDGLQRLADDRARLPQPAARPQGPRRADGRRRPAPHRDRQGGRRAPLRPPGLGRRGRAGHGAHPVRGGADPPAPYVDRVDRVRELVEPFTPEVAERVSGIAADDVRRLAELAAADGGAAYGRIGVSTTGFGSSRSGASSASTS